MRALTLIAATVIALGGCVSDDVASQDETPGGRAERAARERAEEDAKARECAAIRDPDLRDARGC
jgi:hypothetical protein